MRQQFTRFVSALVKTSTILLILGEDVDVIVEPQEDSQFLVEYQPVNAGKHTIKVMFGGQPIQQSPFHVNVSPPKIDPIPSKVKVFGPGMYY